MGTRVRTHLDVHTDTESVPEKDASSAKNLARVEG